MAATPDINAFAERVIQTYQHECLDQFVVINEQQLNVIGHEFQTWYNYERPHSEKNGLPSGDQREMAAGEVVDVVCQTRLGGLLKSYSNRAA